MLDPPFYAKIPKVKDPLIYWLIELKKTKLGSAQCRTVRLRRWIDNERGKPNYQSQLAVVEAAHA